MGADELLIVTGDFTKVTDVDGYRQLYEVTDIDSYRQLYKSYRHFPIETIDSYKRLQIW